MILVVRFISGNLNDRNEDLIIITVFKDTMISFLINLMKITLI